MSSSKEVEFQLRRYFGKQLRRLFYRSPLRRLLGSDVSECASCKESLTKQDADIDHIEPVVPVDREITAAEYFLRMFGYNERLELDLSNFEALCSPCHKAKSKVEMGLRAKNKMGPFSAAAKAKALKTRQRKRRKKYAKRSRA